MKKFLAAFLTICLMISIFSPMSVLAEDDEIINDENTEISDETSEYVPSVDDAIVLEEGNVSVSGYLPEDTVLSVTSLDELKYSPEEEIKKVKKEQIISEQTAKRVTRLLAKSIENSDSPEKLDSYTVAAKTGTSKKPLENGKGYSNKYYTSVIGFLPASNPQVLIYVVIDSPTGYGVFGSTVAAPVFKEIA